MKVWVVSAFTLTILLFTGCGGGGETVSTVPAGGTVKFKGQPLADANVVFHPVGEGEGRRSASGTTDSSGKFTLMTYVDAGKQQSGAVPGEYMVTVSKTSAGAGAAMTPDAMMKSMAGNAAPKKGAKSDLAPDSSLPEKYSNPKNSGLKATVKDGDPNDFPLELTGS